MAILGIISGLGIILLLYVFSMAMYFRARRRWDNTKYMVEIITVFISLAVSIIIKCIILGINSTDSFTSGFTTFIYAIYSGIGGLAFEGLEPLNEISSTLVQCLYTTSSLYAGIIFVSVITAKANYEVYSWVLLRVSATWIRNSSNVDIYIFTTVTEDTLLLAKSINENERYKKSSVKGSEASKKKKHRCIIIFASDKLNSFEKTNPLHRAIVANGFLYWSYSSKVNSEISLLKRLKIRINNDFEYSEEIRTANSSVHIFSFINNNRLSGEESENSSWIYNEINAITKEIVSAKKINWPIVNFYSLSDARVNYNYYQQQTVKTIENAAMGIIKKKVAEIINSICKSSNKYSNDDRDKEVLDKKVVCTAFCTALKKFKLCKCNGKNVCNDADGIIKKIGDITEKTLNDNANDIVEKITESIVNKISNKFQFQIVNEAEFTGNSLAQERVLSFPGDGLLKANRPDKDGKYRVAVFGFGDTGQRALENLFVDTAYIIENDKSSQFIADVYDVDFDNISGLYAMTHPMFACINCRDDVSSVEDSKWAADSKTEEMIREIYGNYVKVKREADSRTEEEIYKEINKFMKIPIIGFHNMSCLGYKFFESLNKTKSKNNYRSFIIALGDDELNISMANALINYFKQDGVSNSEAQCDCRSKKCIYVNIRDEKNCGRIDWSECDEKILNSYKVIIFGNKTKIYSYDQLINVDNAMKYNFYYSKMYDINKKLEDKLTKIGLCEEYTSALQKEFNDIHHSDFEPKIEWLSINIFDKYSNVAAYRFYPYMLSEIKDLKSINFETMINLAKLEHNRWCRFYMANGWKYADEKRKPIKLHKFMCPFDDLDPGTKSLDMINVILAQKLFEEKNQNEH